MARSKAFDKQQVLDKAVDLFWSKGYHVTSAQDLVDTLGISRSSLYDTFGDKHQLFREALSQYRSRRVDPVIEGLTTTQDVEEYIRGMLLSIKAESLADRSFRGCLIVNSTVEMSAADEAVMSYIADMNSSFSNALQKAIQRGQDQGQLSIEFSASALTDLVVNTINGMRVSARSAPSSVMFDHIIELSLSAMKKK